MGDFVKEEPMEGGSASSTSKLECRFKDQSLFKTLLQCSGSIQPDLITFRVRENSMSYVGIDSSHCALVNWELGREAFENYYATTDEENENGDKEFLISVDLELMNKILKICKSKDSVHLRYNSEDKPDVLEVTLLDPRGEQAIAPKEEEGAGSAGNKKAKQSRGGAAPRLNQFSITVKPHCGDRSLELPPSKEDCYHIQLPKDCFRYAQENLMELSVSDQKHATVFMACPREPIRDSRTGNVKKCDVVRFGSQNQSGAMAIDFLVAESLEEKKPKQEMPADAPAAPLTSAKVFLTRKEGFDDQSKCRFSNKWVSKIGLGLPIIENVQIELATEYPAIFICPISEGMGVLRWVVSPHLGTEEEGAADGEGDGGAAAADDDVFAEEDEFSDG
ncbi:unnamed protein product [Amoebophrya sp. A25]|nr:unnamed protein product [Amoebophrya sp. A25]|eukprot:GSA25T00020670001.1